MLYRWNILPLLYVRFSTIIFKNLTMKISDIYVIITGYLLQEIILHWWRINSQQYMLDHPVFHDIPIGTYKQKVLKTFMLEYGVYITLSLNWVKVEEISNIQCYLSTRKLFTKNILQGILSTFMLEYLLILNSSGFWCTYGRYSPHYMSDFPLLYSTISWWKFTIFLLSLLGIFFRWILFIGEE